MAICGKYRHPPIFCLTCETFTQTNLPPMIKEYLKYGKGTCKSVHIDGYQLYNRLRYYSHSAISPFMNLLNTEYGKRP